MTPSVSAVATDAPVFTLVLVTHDAVTVTIDADGETDQVRADEGETLSFSAVEQLDVIVSDGAAVDASIADVELDDLPEGSPWEATFTPTIVEALVADAASASVSANASAGASTTASAGSTPS